MPILLKILRGASPLLVSAIVIIQVVDVAAVLPVASLKLQFCFTIEK